MLISIEAGGFPDSRPACYSERRALSHVKKSNGRNLLLASLFSAASGLAHADIPSLPGAYFPFPEETKVGLLHLQYGEADEAYNGGEKVADDLDISLKQAVFRYLHYEEWNGMPVLVEGGIPIAKQETSGCSRQREVQVLQD